MSLHRVRRNPTSSSAAELQVVLYSAGTAARRMENAERIDSLVALIDWTRLGETLRRRRLLPTLGPRIIELAGGRAGEDFCVTTEEAILTGRRHGGFLQLVTLRALTMLADAGIRAAPLKGPLLGEAIYGDPGRRPSSDIDLLVSPEQLHAAVEVVRELGYLAPADFVYDNGLPLLHFVLVHERGELPPIELHWRVHWYESDFAREQLLPPALDPTAGWRSAPVHDFAALLLFYARDGFVGLRLASDLGAWWDRYGSELPIGAIDDLVESYPRLARAIPAAVLVAEKTSGVPSTGLFDHALELSVRQRLAIRLANPHPTSSRAQLYADIGLVDGLLAPPAGFQAFVRRNILPPSAVLDQQARHGARKRARSPLGRGVGVLVRYGVTMSRLLRDFDPSP